FLAEIKRITSSLRPGATTSVSMLLVKPHLYSDDVTSSNILSEPPILLTINRKLLGILPINNSSFIVYRYTAKLSPQLHVRFALGLLKENPFPLSPPL